MIELKGAGISEAVASSTPCPHTTTSGPVSAAQGGSETTVSQSSSAGPVESTESVPSAGPESVSSSTDAPVTSSPDVSQTESTAAQVSTDSTTAAAVESVTTPSSSGPTDANLVSASPIDQPPVSNVAPFTLQCGDQKFHRHPLRCDLYYMCVWTELHFSIDLKACPQGSNYDEASGSCVSPGMYRILATTKTSSFVEFISPLYLLCYSTISLIKYSFRQDNSLPNFDLPSNSQYRNYGAGHWTVKFFDDLWTAVFGDHRTTGVFNSDCHSTFDYYRPPIFGKLLTTTPYFNSGMMIAYYILNDYTACTWKPLRL